MAKVSVYLNFASQTEDAFNFYKSVFGTEFENEIMRYVDAPPMENMPPLSDSVKNLVMHMQLPIFDGFTLMGSDAPEEMGLNVVKGNNSHIMLQLDTRDQTRSLFKALSEGGKVEMELQDMFWGDYYGNLTDKFGVQWMFICEEKEL